MPTVVETGAASPIFVRLALGWMLHKVSEGETDAEGLDQSRSITQRVLLLPLK